VIAPSTPSDFDAIADTSGSSASGAGPMAKSGTDILLSMTPTRGRPCQSRWTCRSPRPHIFLRELCGFCKGTAEGARVCRDGSRERAACPVRIGHVDSRHEKFREQMHVEQ